MNARYMRGYRILTGRTTTLTVSTALIGNLWDKGDATTRALLSVALDSHVLDACHAIATRGYAEAPRKTSTTTSGFVRNSQLPGRGQLGPPRSTRQAGIRPRPVSTN